MDLLTLKESKYIVIRNYFQVNTDWQAVVNLAYRNASNIGNINQNLWIRFKDRQPFKDMPDLRDFCHTLNKDFKSVYIEGCDFNKDWNKPCNCHGIWHIDTPLLSLSSIAMSKHKDLHPAAYIQILGKSFWKIDDEKEEITVNPSDLVLIYKGIDHEVRGEGPRFAVLMSASGTKSKV